jgi:hypothetical protein
MKKEDRNRNDDDISTTLKKDDYSDPSNFEDPLDRSSQIADDKFEAALPPSDTFEMPKSGYEEPAEIFEISTDDVQPTDNSQNFKDDMDAIFSKVVSGTVVGGPKVDENVKKLAGMPKQYQCMAVAFAGGVQGAIAGYIFGGLNHAFISFFSGRHRLPGFRQEFFYSCRSTSSMFGLWLCTFYGAHCSITALRNGNRDATTSFGSGFIAGAVATLRTRNFPAILTNAVTSGILVTVFDILPK